MFITILRILFILLGIISAFCLLIGVYFYFFVLQYFWFLALPFVVFLVIWIINFFLLNRKAKIFSLTLGGIFGIIFVLIYNFFFSNWWNNEIFWKTSQNFLALEEIDENLLTPKKVDNKNISPIPKEQEEKLKSLYNIADSYPNLFKNSHINSQFIKENPNSLFEKWQAKQKINTEMEKILRDFLKNHKDKFSINTNLENLVTKLDTEYREKYEQLQNEKDQKIDEIKLLQNSEQTIKEKSKIFTEKYLKEYREFLITLNEIHEKNSYTRNDSISLSKVRILANHILLGALYKNNIYTQESLDILADVLENQKTQYTQRGYKESQSPSWVIGINNEIAVYSIAINAIKDYIDLWWYQKDFTKIIHTLENFDEKEEYNENIKQEYKNTKEMLPDIIKEKISNYNESATLDTKIYNPEETDLLLKHLYGLMLREIDSSIPRFSYETNPEFSPLENFYEFLTHQWKIDIDKIDSKNILDKIQLASTPNYIGRTIVLILIPGITNYKERILVEKFYRIQLLEQLKNYKN